MALLTSQAPWLPIALTWGRSRGCRSGTWPSAPPSSGGTDGRWCHSRCRTRDRPVCVAAPGRRGRVRCSGNSGCIGGAAAMGGEAGGSAPDGWGRPHLHPDAGVVVALLLCGTSSGIWLGGGDVGGLLHGGRGCRQARQASRRATASATEGVQPGEPRLSPATNCSM